MLTVPLPAGQRAQVREEGGRISACRTVLHLTSPKKKLEDVIQENEGVNEKERRKEDTEYIRGQRVGWDGPRESTPRPREQEQELAVPGGGPGDGCHRCVLD